MPVSKHILVTEIDSEVGASVAKSLCNAGWQVSGLGQKNAQGSDYSCDLMNRDEVEKLVLRIEQEKGPLGGLVVASKFNSASFLPFLEASPAQWQERLDAWLKLATNIGNAVGKLMVQRKSGQIMILTPDFKAVKGDCIIEATACGALHGFIKSFGAEVAADKVCVNGLYAGLPFDLEAINAMCAYLLEEGDYVSAQLISIAGKA